MASAPPLQARNLTVVHGKRKLLDNISVSLDAGQILALVGPNGAGKSTLMKTLAGILSPQQGQVFFEGQSHAALPQRERARRLAYVPQHSALDAPMPAREVVPQGRFLHRDRCGRSRPTTKVLSPRRLKPPARCTWRIGLSPACPMASGDSCCSRAPWPPARELFCSMNRPPRSMSPTRCPCCTFCAIWRIADTP